MTVCHASSIALDEENIVYFGPQGAHWRVPLASVRVIGELRSMDLEEGHFLALVVDAHDAWFQVPCCAVGMDRVLAELGRILHCDLGLRLGTSRVPSSRVVWPDELAARELFVLPTAADAEQSNRSSRWTLHPDLTASALRR